jgi:hypothetical protein
MAYDPTSYGGMGGGIYALAPLIATESLFIANNTIIGNIGTAFLAEEGGGIAVSIPPQISGPEPIPDRIVIANNIIAFNTSGIFETLTSPMVPPTLVNNDLFNTDGDYLNVPAGATDINQDPLFIDKDGGDQAVADLVLMPEATARHLFLLPLIIGEIREYLTAIEMDPLSWIWAPMSFISLSRERLILTATARAISRSGGRVPVRGMPCPASLPEHSPVRSGECRTIW